jgi:hypothetical protein
MKKAVLPIFVILAFTFAANSQIYHGLLHDFTDGNNHGWQRGEVVENKLHITADGSGNQGKLVTFSQDEFAGNYLEAGVHTISAKISNASDQALHMRVALGTGSNPKQGEWFASKDAIIVDPGEMDKEVAFMIKEDDMVLVAGNGTYADVMANVVTIRILHSMEADAQGDNIVATAHIDDILAIGETTFISETNNLLEISSIYPNPVTDYAHISIKTESAFSAQLSILNLLGQVVYQEEVRLPLSAHSLNLSILNSGAYILKAELNEQVKLMKFVVQ